MDKYTIKLNINAKHIDHLWSYLIIMGKSTCSKKTGLLGCKCGVLACAKMFPMQL